MSIYLYVCKRRYKFSFNLQNSCQQQPLSIVFFGLCVCNFTIINENSWYLKSYSANELCNVILLNIWFFYNSTWLFMFYLIKKILLVFHLINFVDKFLKDSKLTWSWNYMVYSSKARPGDILFKVAGILD